MGGRQGRVPPLPERRRRPSSKPSKGSEKPSLVNSNLASYTALLGQEGLRLIRNSIEDGWSPGTINYSVSFVARIPSLSVNVWGESHDVYNEIKEHCTIIETYRNGNSTRTYQYPQVSSLTELRDIFTSLHIEYNLGDFRGPVATAATTRRRRSRTSSSPSCSR